jgi:hypothetical protein
MKHKVIAQLALGDSKLPFNWETSDRWQEVVSEPVIKYPISPRQARAVLEVFGYLSSFGVDPIKIAQEVFEKHEFEIG